eukprot:TRINITY_DN106626_c0_g1_i1.p1 TRINITY_DN106626_c0_g1~~TRINITY_DN106626_c0_g1_i1.p1  ORF type:complete len:222 (+),score=48.58 TRINITY_DN106626_c0_g1_i1:121-786(+)
MPLRSLEHALLTPLQPEPHHPTGAELRRHVSAFPRVYEGYGSRSDISSAQAKAILAANKKASATAKQNLYKLNEDAKRLHEFDKQLKAKFDDGNKRHGEEGPPLPPVNPLPPPPHLAAAQWAALAKEMASEAEDLKAAAEFALRKATDYAGAAEESVAQASEAAKAAAENVAGKMVTAASLGSCSLALAALLVQWHPQVSATCRGAQLRRESRVAACHSFL